MDERGRSMTEILSVLAIVGILSIIAISGYNYAINKHRSNVILNDVKRIITVVLASNFMEKENNFFDTMDIEIESNAPYTIAKETDKTFYITVGETSQKTCDILTSEKPPYAEDTTANAMTTKTCDEGENDIYFYINMETQEIPDAEKPKECNVDNPCGPCAKCTAGRCIDDDSACPNDQYCINGTCGCKKGQIKDRMGVCLDCDTTNRITTSLNECQKCPNRVFSLNNCFICPTNSHHNDSHTACVCDSDMFWQMGGTGASSICSVCSEYIYVHAIPEECLKCPNQFTTEENACYGCKIEGGSLTRKTTLSNCNRCPNRYFDTASSTCKICPADAYKNPDGTGCL